MQRFFRFFSMILLLLLLYEPNVSQAQTIPTPDSLLRVLEFARIDSVKIKALVGISRYFEPKDLSQSLHYAEAALELARQQTNEHWEAYALFNIGNVTFNIGLFDLSARYFNQYLEIQKAAKNENAASYALFNLGAIHLKLEHIEQAKNYYLNAIESIKVHSDNDSLQHTDRRLIFAYNNLGIIHRRLHEYEAAKDYFLRGISLSGNAQGEQSILSMLLNNLGSVYLDLKQTEEAFKVLTEALDIRLKTGDKSGEASSYRMLALYSKNLNELKKAEDLLKKGLNIARQTGNISLQADISESLFELYQEMNKADSALRYHILLKELTEKMNHEETLKELNQIELTAQFEKRELQRQALQQKRETRMLIISVLLILLIVIFGLLYFLSLSRMKRLRLEKENINLASKNLSLEKSSLESELEIKNKELATNVMYQIQKNELIRDIVQKLMRYSMQLRREDQHLMLDIIKGLERTQENTAWSEFELRFQQVHNEFYNKLNEINPELSPNDRRLCAFLRLNMTTKEIASITNQSVRSLEVARTRLRKKLNLTNSETGLIEFLSHL